MKKTQTQKTQTIKLIDASNLLRDDQIYPRESILDLHNVSTMVETLESGGELPPIIVEKTAKSSKRVVDGWHRLTAYRRVGGATAMVPVYEKAYKNDAEIFLDAMQYNSQHGRKLTAYDRARCKTMADVFGISVERTAEALSTTIEALSKIMSDHTAKDGETIIKRSIIHMKGKVITKKQKAVVHKLSGHAQTFDVNQLILLIENDLLDVGNPNLMHRLGILKGYLDDIIGDGVVAEVG